MPGSRSAVGSSIAKPIPILWAERVLETELQAQDVLSRRADSEIIVARRNDDGHHYCLKVIRRQGTGSPLRLEHEARRLMKLSSAHAPAVRAVAREAEALLVVFDYVSGPSLEQLFRRRPPFSFENSMAVLECLLLALRDIHRCGVLRRGVRPANLLLQAGDPRATTLVDFGPTRAWDVTDLGCQRRGDLAWFLSPEQAGSIDQDISPASDLYSAGVVFYYCLTGESPFVGCNIGEVLLSHLTTPVPKLRELGIDVPRSVDEMIQRLSCKAPRDP